MMTPEETRQAAQVMLAHAEGKRIQWRDAEDESDPWEDYDGPPSWNWDAWQYRVAPERWAGKIWVHDSGLIMNADQWNNPQGRSGWRLIEAKEVEP